MKKIFTIVFCIATAAMLLTTLNGQSLADRIKRSACEKVCERSYRNCMEGSGKALDSEKEGYDTDVKDAAKEESCQVSKEKCLEKCNE